MKKHNKDCFIVALIVFIGNIIILGLTMKISHMTSGEWLNKTDLIFYGVWTLGCALFMFGWTFDTEKAKREMIDFEEGRK